ncbi:uncharacterized protein LOC114299241 [Camellia sinensis]|uniref:uncharacterized protein LOC114299241 n=1 Tax=Camellia sinensis TaxID=4442 RepID=UPI001035737F|nr:uncharacterized protein LOC114299241 [Camellia sinensis]
MENRSPKMDGSSADFLHLGNHEISDFAFEYPYLQKIRVAEKVTGRFNISDSPPPYSKQRRSENDRDFITPDETWYPMGGRKCDIRDVINQQAWSCFVTENAEESLSWLRLEFFGTDVSCYFISLLLLSSKMSTFWFSFVPTILTVKNHALRVQVIFISCNR